MNKIKKFNYEYIYLSKILKASDNYFEIVINEIYDTLKDCYDEQNTFNKLKDLEKFYPNLIHGFIDWLNNFYQTSKRDHLKNKILFDISNPKDYYSSIISYISGMTDKFAIDMYNEIISY